MGSRALERAAQGRRGVFLSGDFQNARGHDPVSSAVGDTALADVLDWVISRGPFQPEQFCDADVLSPVTVTAREEGSGGRLLVLGTLRIKLFSSKS